MKVDRRTLLACFLGAPIAASLPTRNDLDPASRPDALAVPPEPATVPHSPLLEAWLKQPRQPLDLEYLDWATEYARNELHHELTAPEGSRAMADAYRARLREIDLARQLLPRLRHGGPVHFSYHGGSSPGTSRTALPTMLFTVPDEWCIEITWPEMDPIYLLAHCSVRNAPRTFKLANIGIIKSVI